MFAVIEFKGRLVAAGAVESQPAIWVSDDGLTWTAVSDPDLTPPQGKIRDLALGGPGLVAVGEAFTGEDWSPRPAIWTSSDGIEWVRVPHDPAVFGFQGGGAIGDVVSGPSGLVAVGGEFLSGNGLSVWRSADGHSWTRLPPNPDLGGINDLVVFNDTYVAIGAYEGAAVWLSPDGLEWTRASVSPGGDAAHSWMDAVTVFGNALVAVGNSDGPAVWRSETGADWTLVFDIGFDATLLGSGHRMWAVAASDAEAIGVGWTSGPGADDAAAWWSVDGVSWDLDLSPALGGSDAQSLFAVTPFRDGFVAVGQEGVAAAAWYFGDN